LHGKTKIQNAKGQVSYPRSRRDSRAEAFTDKALVKLAEEKVKTMSIQERINYVLIYLQLKFFPPEGFNRKDAKTLAKTIATKAHREVV